MKILPITSNPELHKKVRIARYALGKVSLPYASLAARLPDFISPDVPTACTNGELIIWGEDFLRELSQPEVAGVLLHETLHCAHLHFARMPAPTYQPQLANIAWDYEINQICERLACPRLQLPKCRLLDAKFDGWSAERIYAYLLRSAKKMKMTGTDPGGCGGAEPAPEGNGGQSQPPGQAPAPSALAEGWKAAVQRAAMASALGKLQGQGAGDLSRLAGAQASPMIDWKQELRDYVGRLAQARPDWSRPHRRRGGGGIILPRETSIGAASFVVIRDTSGSVDPAGLAQWNAEIESIRRELHLSLRILDCDAAVCDRGTFEPHDPLPPDGKGGGGTDFAPALGHESIQEAEACIYLTDGFGSFPDSPPCKPLLWAILGNPDFQAPFGRVVHIK